MFKATNYDDLMYNVFQYLYSAANETVKLPLNKFSQYSHTYIVLVHLKNFCIEMVEIEHKTKTTLEILYFKYCYCTPYFLAFLTWLHEKYEWLLTQCNAIAFTSGHHTDTCWKSVDYEYVRNCHLIWTQVNSPPAWIV